MNYKFYAKKPNGEPVRINVTDNLSSGCWDVLIDGELIEERGSYAH